MNQMVVNSQNQAALEAVKNILVTACSEPAFNQQNASKVTQRSRLDDLHFPSLGDPTFGAVKANVTNNAKLASRLLEIITDTQ
jgi:neurofibromin 1